MSEYAYLAVNLRRYRAESGLTQAMVAQRAGAGFRQRYVSDLERGLCPSDPSHVKRLAVVFGVPETALLRRVRRRAVRAAA